jgi:hypothetical protein
MTLQEALDRRTNDLIGAVNELLPLEEYPKYSKRQFTDVMEAAQECVSLEEFKLYISYKGTKDNMWQDQKR